ncbi:MAG: DUF4349 domain-containing protein [Bacteroidia bacterium]|nr:DUF4349 domain-containing protein [Bacteroidia bacterium]NNJ55889.1 DUF4349 domain-containing protein [Bacteroidia bacterium]
MKKYLVLILFFAFACNRSEMHSDNNYATAEASGDYEELSEKSLAKSQLERDDAGSDFKPINDLKLIKTGSCTFETESLKATADRIKIAIAKHNGYASNESENKTSYRINRTVQIRVPSDKFDKLLEDISVGVNRFDEREISVSDVTEVYYDISARLKTKKQIETRYIQLLSRAGKIPEVLEVERQIGEVRTEIDRLEGKLKYLKNQVSFSTLRVTYYESLEAQAENNYGFINKLKRSFVNGWDMVLSVFLGLITIWPLLLLAVVVGLLIRRYKLKKS